MHSETSKGAHDRADHEAPATHPVRASNAAPTTHPDRVSDPAPTTHPDRVSDPAPTTHPDRFSDTGATTPRVRASDAERERVIDRLREAAAEGRLTFEELADRIGEAGGARDRSDLEALIADLPGAGAALATNDPSGEIVAVPTRRSALFGDVRRSGAWAVPATSRWETLFGDVVLDLREAQVTAPEVTIDAGTIFGDVDVLVPEGVVVEVRSRTLIGSVRQNAGEVGPAGTPRVILTGGTVFGDVRVRSSRLRERLAARLGGAGRS